MLSWASSLFGGGGGASQDTGAGAGDVRDEPRADVRDEPRAPPDPKAASARGRLERYDPASGTFSPVLDSAQVSMFRTDPAGSPFAYTFVVADDKGAVQVSQAVDHGMQVQFNRNAHSMVWVLSLGAPDDLDADLVSLSFVFADPSEEDKFKMAIATRLYEASRQESFEKTVKSADSAWVLNANADVDDTLPPGEPMEFDSDWGSNDDDDDDDDAGQQQDADESRRVMVTPPRARDDRRSSVFMKNSQLAVGMGSDRSFVVRGSDVGVFKHGRDGMQYMASIDQVRGSDGSVFSPTKVMLHDRDRKMLMLRADRDNSIVEYDLETQQIVQEYNAGDDNKIRDIGPESRFAQMTGTEMITGLNRNSLFAMDPRINATNKVVQDFTYTANPHMSCVSSTGASQYAVGSDKGEIRMFSAIGKRAKTLLPGLGHAITAVDVSADGQWLLATTDRYIMLVSTLLDDGRTGFQVSMGKSKPVPIKLQLSPQDLVKHGIREVRFRRATFDMPGDSKEQFIVSATGNLLVTWKMKDVQRGRLNDYTVKVYDESVVADQFRYGHSDVVVALPDDVKRARFRNRK
ncbi:Vacuolar import/degradation Vid27 C-terminal domain-containing protein [Plasmodiophora brassicae]|uniref:Vacuolar import/degradation Vid27 C-terminal domain-containing protein n=1 Tax=Plasmodiophora brassicae TaxID=37360 RepID=A0A0G4IST2_PLABS|nr:hypothetical protein PBRA_006439 [Plasmodiophora brassicae]SPQ94410.1 unnamed protein product [Plasmodiophora brassicae]